LFQFITKRPLWLNILAGIILGLGIFALVLLSLNWVTHHNESNVVPSVVGKNFDDATKLLEKAGFDVEIQDSIYTDTAKALTVLRQFPESDEVVKVNRKVYLTITRFEPPLIEMPNLVGYSLRNAEMVLKNLNIRIGETVYKPDFAKGSILQQLFNGSPIAPGTKIKMGSSVTLVIADGGGTETFMVPNLIGQRFGDAKQQLESAGLGFGVIMGDVSDTLNSYIYWQSPQRYDEEKKLQYIRTGQLIDVRLQIEKPAVTDSTGQLQPQL